MMSAMLWNCIAAPCRRCADLPRRDAKKAWELCAGLLAGEIVIFDKAYLDLRHLWELFKRKINWVTRAKEGMNFRVVRRYQQGREANILRDDVVQVKSSASRRLYP